MCAQTLAESAKLSDDQLRAGVIEMFTLESPLIDRLPYMEIEGNSYKYNEEATLPAVEWRAVNAAYSESTGTVNPKVESLYIVGGDADCDTFIQKTRSNLNDQRAYITRGKVKALAYEIQNTFINGDGEDNPNQFDGLKRRLINSQLKTSDTNGMGIVEAGHNFLDVLDALVASVPGCNALYMNGLIKAKIGSSLRRLGGWHTYLEAETGKTIQSYNGVALLDIGSKPDGTMIIPQSETVGTSNDCSSIYAVKFGPGEESDAAITGLTNGGVQVRDMGEMQTKSALRTRIEFFNGIAIFGGKAAARLQGVRNR